MPQATLPQATPPTATLLPEATLRRVYDLAALEPAWRELEARSTPSFFQSWTWVGCQVAERYDDPVLLEVTQAGRTTALALFNRRRRLLGETLWLGETGRPAHDAVFVEHNGPLVASGCDVSVQCCLATALSGGRPGRRAWRRRLVLSGIGERVEGAARAVGTVGRRQMRAAPFVDLRRIGPGDYLDSLGRSTRYQLRRSLREIGRRGPVDMRRAETVEEALAYLDELARLHQASWQRRGKPGSFANPAFMAFHRALVARGVPRGEIDLWRLAAGPDSLAYLYNFRLGGHVNSYQSGIDYDRAGPNERFGMTAHHLAIEHARRSGDHAYDFLAGDSRYKTNFSNADSPLFWIEVVSGAGWWQRAG